MTYVLLYTYVLFVLKIVNCTYILIFSESSGFSLKPQSSTRFTIRRVESVTLYLGTMEMQQSEIQSESTVLAANIASKNSPVPEVDMHTVTQDTFTQPVDTQTKSIPVVNMKTENTSIPPANIQPEDSFGDSETTENTSISQFDIPAVDKDDLLARGKLALLVDLDNTILHTAKRRGQVIPGMQNVVCWSSGTKEEDKHYSAFRPGLRAALEQWNKMYDLYVCTMAGRAYAKCRLKIIDPHDKLFKRRIFSRKDMTNRKSKMNAVKSLYPSGDTSTLVIIDDLSSVWSGVGAHLLNVKPYHYFDEKISISEKYQRWGQPKRDPDHYLRKTLTPTLYDIHCQFFCQLQTSSILPQCVNVKDIIARKRCKILPGVIIYFLLTKKERSCVRELTNNAVAMGATIKADFDLSVTHIVAKEQGEELAAHKNSKHFYNVNPSWIEDCYVKWRRVNERKHMCRVRASSRAQTDAMDESMNLSTGFPASEESECRCRSK